MDINSPSSSSGTGGSKQPSAAAAFSSIYAAATQLGVQHWCLTGRSRNSSSILPELSRCMAVLWDMKQEQGSLWRVLPGPRAMQ